MSEQFSFSASSPSPVASACSEIFHLFRISRCRTDFPPCGNHSVELVRVSIAYVLIVGLCVEAKEVQEPKAGLRVIFSCGAVHLRFQSAAGGLDILCIGAITV